tara:strand:+ start:1419 stop:2009 length:591 start_codon:yes stop_codon:yes gene_type:complete
VKPVFTYIIKPKGKRYNNTVDVDDKELIINSDNFQHQHVNREAIVTGVPTAYKTVLQEGDTVIVHHNVFRRWKDMRGVEKNSKAYYKDDMYFVFEDQIFAYKRNNIWKPLEGYCFVKPIKPYDKLSVNKEEPLMGIVKHSDGTIQKGSLVGFKPNGEYEFIIDNERLYRVLSKYITIQYEYKGQEEEYNPSWLQSS